MNKKWSIQVIKINRSDSSPNLVDAMPIWFPFESFITICCIKNMVWHSLSYPNPCYRLNSYIPWSVKLINIFRKKYIQTCNPKKGVFIIAHCMVLIIFIALRAHSHILVSTLNPIRSRIESPKFRKLKCMLYHYFFMVLAKLYMDYLIYLMSFNVWFYD